jgi:hypothetical protein
MKWLAKLLLGISTLLMVLVLVLGLSGQFVGKASGLKMFNYTAPNLTPSIEICEVVQVQAVGSDLFQIPN